MSLPCGVVVSAHVSFKDLKPAPRSATSSRTLSRSRVDLAKPIQPCDDEYVALLKSADHLHKLGAVSLGAARLLAVDTWRNRRSAVRAPANSNLGRASRPSVAVHRHRFAPLSQIRYAANKRRLFNVKFFLRNLQFMQVAHH